MDYRFLTERFHDMRERQIQNHGRVVSDIDKQVSTVVLNAALKAMESVRSGVVRTEMQAVPLGTGLGKSSSAYALIAAFALHDMEFSAAYVVPTIKMGIEAQEGIEALLGEGTTALWTSLHKHKGVDRRRAVEELGFVPARTVDKATLGTQRIIIVTHKALEREFESGKADGILQFFGRRRSVVFIDEHPELLRQVQVTPEDVQAMHDQLQRLDPDHAWLHVMSKAVYRMSELTHGTGPCYIPASLFDADDVRAFDNEDEVSLWEMTDSEASDSVRMGEQAGLKQVLDFLRAAALGRVFYSRKDCQFYAYSLHFGAGYPGFVLLDATSELAGLVTLNPHVTSVPVVHVNYEQLEVFSMGMPKEFSKVKDVLKQARLSSQYRQCIKESVLANTQSGDEVLLVVHKDVLSMELVGAISENPAQPTDWDGRKVNAQNWGAGVGSNKYRDKTHVFMFGSYYLPRSTTIAQTHGWSEQPLSDSQLKQAESVRVAGNWYAPQGAFRQVHDGNILRWVKQLAMRGKARCLDGNGKCLPMKLFLTMDLEMLLPNMHRLFPSAPMPKPAELPSCVSPKEVQGRQGLLRMAMSSNRACISAEEIQSATGIVTRNLSQEFKALGEPLQQLGWSLVSAKEIGLAGRMKYLIHEDRFIKPKLAA